MTMPIVDRPQNCVFSWSRFERGRRRVTDGDGEWKCVS